MSRAAKGWVSLGVGLAGLALHRISPAAGAFVSGAALWGACFAMLGFNVPPTAIAHRLAIAVAAASAYLYGGAAIGLAVLSAGVATWGPDQTIARSIGMLGSRILQITAMAVGLIALALSAPFEWRDLAVAPAFALGAVGTFFATTGLFQETLPNLRGPRRIAIAVGQSAPAIVLPRRSGHGEFDLAAERGTNVLLCFLRGDWCAYCHVLMRMYQRSSDILRKHGVKLVMVNPSSGDEARRLAADMGLEYEILVDEDLKATKALGIASETKMSGKHYPLPVAFFVDRQGVVRYVSKVSDPSVLTPAKLEALVAGSGG